MSDSVVENPFAATKQNQEHQLWRETWPMQFQHYAKINEKKYFEVFNIYDSVLRHHWLVHLLPHLLDAIRRFSIKDKLQSNMDSETKELAIPGNCSRIESRTPCWTWLVLELYKLCDTMTTVLTKYFTASSTPLVQSSGRNSKYPDSVEMPACSSVRFHAAANFWIMDSRVEGPNEPIRLQVVLRCRFQNIINDKKGQCGVNVGSWVADAAANSLTQVV